VKVSRFLPKTTLVLALALAACQQQPAGSEAEPDAKPGLSVSDGVLVLPAVKGNPGAALFSITNGSGQPTTLAAVHIDGAGKTEMHETKGGKMEPLNWVQLNAGETVRFERGGKHVMVFDVTEKLAAGGSTEMTLTFSGGDKLSTPVAIEAAGGGDAMDHGDKR
jgi:copper(I)-binding protein